MLEKERELAGDEKEEDPEDWKDWPGVGIRGRGGAEDEGVGVRCTLWAA